MGERCFEPAMLPLTLCRSEWLGLGQLKHIGPGPGPRHELRVAALPANVLDTAGAVPERRCQPGSQPACGCQRRCALKRRIRNPHRLHIMLRRSKKVSPRPVAPHTTMTKEKLARCIAYIVASRTGTGCASASTRIFPVSQKLAAA